MTVNVTASGSDVKCESYVTAVLGDRREVI